MINYKAVDSSSKIAILELYDDAGWSSYTNDPEKLMRAVDNSNYVMGAWDDERLVGLIRCVGDGETILFIQDLLVMKAYKRRGIGKMLITKTLERYKHIRQTVLNTDASEEANAFYKNLGFQAIEAVGGFCYVIYR